MSKLWTSFHGKRKTYASSFYHNLRGRGADEAKEKTKSKEKKDSTHLTPQQLEACKIKSKFYKIHTRRSIL